MSRSDPRSPERTARGQRRLTWRGRLFLLGLSLALSLLAAELGLRVLAIFPPEPRYFVGELENRDSETFVADPHTGWRMRPSFDLIRPWGNKEILYRSNSEGFRSPREFEPSDVSRRIAIVGDSHSYGLGLPYDRTYGAQLEKRLGDAEVWNFSMPGFGVDQMWQSLRHQVLPRRPDLVVVGLYPADFRRSQTAYRASAGFNKPLFRVVDGRLEPRGPADRPAAAIRFLERHSYLWALGRIAWRWAGFRWPVGEFWHLNEAILDAMRKDCAEAGVPVVFLFIPFRSFHPFPMLQDSMARAGAAFLYLSAAPPDERERMFFDDGHLSGRGHHHVAELLHRWLEEREAAPPER
jgi:hypothetical protein